MSTINLEGAPRLSVLVRARKVESSCIFCKSGLMRSTACRSCSSNTSSAAVVMFFLPSSRRYQIGPLTCGRILGSSCSTMESKCTDGSSLTFSLYLSTSPCNDTSWRFNSSNNCRQARVLPVIASFFCQSFKPGIRTRIETDRNSRGLHRWTSVENFECHAHLQEVSSKTERSLAPLSLAIPR